MFPVKRFKFDNEQQAVEAMIAIFGADENGELIADTENYSVSMLGVKVIHEYDEKGEIVNTVTKDGFHVNVVSREPLDVTDNVINPLTPWVKVQGE